MNQKEILEWIQAEGKLIPIEVRRQAWKQSGFSYWDTVRPNFGIMLLLRGQMEFLSKGGTLTAQAGDVIFLPKYCRYRVTFAIEQGVVEDYLLNFDSDVMCECDVPIRLCEGENAEGLGAFENLYEAMYGLEHSRLRVKGAFYLLLDAILWGQRERLDEAHRIVIRAQELLQEDALSVAEIAKKCCVSESTLRRVFREQMGRSCVQYRQEHRLSRAMEMLQCTDRSVEAVAEAVGFFDAAYFCKRFRAFTGMTPKEYAKSKKL